MGKSFQDLTPDEHRLNSLKGEAVEQFAKEYYEAEGWTVVKTQDKIQEGDKFKSVLNPDRILTLKQGQHILEDLEALNCMILQVRYPDLVCEKGKTVMFVEAKSGDVSIDIVKQKETMEVLAHMGYKVLVFKLPITREELVNNTFYGKEVQPTVIEYVPDKADEPIRVWNSIGKADEYEDRGYAIAKADDGNYLYVKRKFPLCKEVQLQLTDAWKS